MSDEEEGPIVDHLSIVVVAKSCLLSMWFCCFVSGQGSE